MPAMTGPNLSDPEREFFAEHLANQLAGRGLQVTTSKQMATLIGLERQKQLLGCSEDGTSCLTELANALGVDAVLSGEIGRIDGGELQANLKVVRSSDGQLLASTSFRASSSADALDRLTWAARSLSEALSQKLKRYLPPPSAEVMASEEEATRPMRRRAWIPAATSGALLAGAGVLYYLSTQRYQSLAADQGTLYDSDARRLRDEGTQLQFFSGVAAGAATAALATAATFYFWRTEPDEVRLAFSAGPNGAAFALTGVFR